MVTAEFPAVEMHPAVCLLLMSVPKENRKVFSLLPLLLLPLALPLSARLRVLGSEKAMGHHRPQQIKGNECVRLRK
jgi:hypothetical protein